MIAFALGFALARANSCTVASTRRLVIHRRADWLLGLFVAISWAGMTLLSLAWLSPSSFNFPAALPIGGKLVTGSFVLGIGALLNQGCFLGSVSQLGRGNLRYLLTLVGMGAALRVFDDSDFANRTATGRSPAEALLAVKITWFSCIAVLVFGIMIIYGARTFARRPTGPMAALVAVGIFGAAIYILNPGWSYMSLIDRTVHGQFLSIWSAEIAVMALFAGSILSSMLRSRFELVWPSPRTAVASLMGGFLLGAGARLIPGGNDTLMLWSIPGLAGYGLVAYLLMIATIAALLIVRPFAVRAMGKDHQEVSALPAPQWDPISLLDDLGANSTHDGQIPR